MSSTGELKPFTKNPQVTRELERILKLTLEEVSRGEVAGLTLVISRPETHEANGGVCIRKAWEDRTNHIAGLSIALADATRYE